MRCSEDKEKSDAVNKTVDLAIVSLAMLIDMNNACPHCTVYSMAMTLLKKLLAQEESVSEDEAASRLEAVHLIMTAARAIVVDEDDLDMEGRIKNERLN